jgi:hypothetical protein
MSSPAFDERVYLREMALLLDQAVARMAGAFRETAVYTVSIWTDPDAGVSAVSFDTAENSAQKVAEAAEWSARYHDRYLAAGNLDMARFFAPAERARNVNPRDFAFPELATVEHRSFPKHWHEDTGGACWAQLGPALRRVQARALPRCAELRLSSGAELAINSAVDWYDHPLKIHPAEHSPAR